MIRSAPVISKEYMMRQILFFTLLILQFASKATAGLIHFEDNTQAIYGKDDRRFVDSHSSQKINELSKSIALIVSEDSIDKKFFTSLINANVLTDSTGINLCADEKFANHHSLNSCTGFLITPDLVVSAGHCFMSPEDCASKKIIFNVRSGNEVDKGYKVFNSAIYECSEIVKNSFDADNNQDFAVVRLKRKVFGIRPLTLRTKGTISTADQVFMIGHPLGLPLVSTTDAFVNDISNPHFFKATLDSFEGNSGSPVFNSKTFEVEGILVRGEDDFVEDSTKKCYRDQVYDQGTMGSPSLKGEGVSRISEILPL